jgi:hypothetical protein
MRYVLSCVFAFLSVQFAFPSEPIVKWIGEVRARGEVDGRDFLTRTIPNSYALLRSRLGANITPVENVQIFLQVQDSRSFGEETVGGRFNTISNTRNLDLHQGYLKIDDLFLDGLSAKAGRMELSYGNERLVGPVGWNNVGRSFDGAVIKLEVPSQSIEGFVTNIAETNTPPIIATPSAVTSVRDSGQLFSGIYYSLHSVKKHIIDAYVFHQWDQRKTSSGKFALSRLTVGTYFKGAAARFSYEGEFAYQLGKRLGADIQAFILTGAVGYSFPGFPISSVTVGYDYLSGAGATSSTYRSFDPAFHTGHKFYGFMDYFIDIPWNTSGRGLQDMIVKIVLKPSENSSITMRGHNFLLAKRFVDRILLGQEIDLVGVLNYNENVAFELGASGFVPDELMRFWFGGSDVAWWGYCAARVWF